PVGVEYRSNPGHKLGGDAAHDGDTAQRYEANHRPEQAVGNVAVSKAGRDVSDMGYHHYGDDAGQDPPSSHSDQPPNPCLADCALCHITHLFLGVLTYGNQTPHDESIEIV